MISSTPPWVAEQDRAVVLEKAGSTHDAEADVGAMKVEQRWIGHQCAHVFGDVRPGSLQSGVCCAIPADLNASSARHCVP